MKKNQNIKHKIPLDVEKQINDLLAEAEQGMRKIDEGRAESKKLMSEINKIDTEIDKSIHTIEGLFSDLDKIEKEAGDELDKLILKQAEDSAA